jgi:cobalt/nickel transport system permease protein
MHIPDNFLSPPVWAALDAAAVPAVGLAIRRAGRELDESRVPLLGVMGAFVFAAQMINFPVGVGTSGHLVGGALLACVLGVAPASLVMTAIIAIQAIVFQDGGILALGANILNMAVVGVILGAWPYRTWKIASRNQAIFIGAFLSVMASGSLALAELTLSGIAMPRPLAFASLALFGVSGLIEGAITVSVVQALEKLNPRFVPDQDGARRRTLAALGAAALLIGIVGFLLASRLPDGIQNLGIQLGLVARVPFHSPLADYSFGSFDSPWLRKATAGLAGLLLIYSVCAVTARAIGRRRSA